MCRLLGNKEDLRISWLWTAVYLVLTVPVSIFSGSVIIASGQGQVVDLKRLERSGNGQCASTEVKERARNEIHGLAILAVTGHIHTCNGTPGWRCVAFINMTDTSYNCPTGLNLTSYSKRTRGRSHTTHGGCSSTTFIVGGLPYSRVCGRIRAYQFGVTGAFWASNNQPGQRIDGFYVGGVSLTHGAAGRRQHIWTFAAGLNEVSNTNFLDANYKCPCDISHNFNHVPAFIGNDYFCESGLHSPWSFQYIFYPNDVLWDGQNCTSTSTCCQFNNPPWFTKNLPSETTEDIELRICVENPDRSADVPLEFIELYVQ